MYTNYGKIILKYIVKSEGVPQIIVPGILWDTTMVMIQHEKWDRSKNVNTSIFSRLLNIESKPV
jgi:hypothetical protein